MKRRFGILLLALSLVLSGCGVSTGGTPGAASAPATPVTQAETEGLEPAEVVRVVDGDTIRVLVDGDEYPLRMIGIDTPESVHADESKNTEAGVEASEYTKAQLTAGQTVYLETDVSNTDKYGRLLRYVWLELPEDPSDETEIREKMYNARLLLEGYANAYRYGDDTKHYDLFLQLEYEAYEAETGLWAQEGALPTDNIDEVEKRLAAEDAAAGEYAYIGNAKSQKFHTLYCGNLPAEQNRVYFQDREQATAAGYEPCGSCKP